MVAGGANLNVSMRALMVVAGANLNVSMTVGYNMAGFGMFIGATVLLLVKVTLQVNIFLQQANSCLCCMS